MSYSCSDLADDMLAFCVRQGIVTNKQTSHHSLNDRPDRQAELMMQGILKLVDSGITARGLVDSLLEYTQNYARLAGEPDEGSCQRTIAQAEAYLAVLMNLAPPQPAGDAITIPCTLTYPDQLCYDLMCTAAEGGINYWADIIGRKMRKVPGSEVPDYESFEADIQSGPVACDHPDIEATEIGRFTMDAATMRQGIARLLAPNAQVSPATRNCVLLMGMDSEADQGDAETADSIVQFAVFGEIVFG
jgi:hypothetical protein